MKNGLHAGVWGVVGEKSWNGGHGEARSLSLDKFLNGSKL